MFTGIVEEIGAVLATGAGNLTLSGRETLKGTVPGDSMAVNGVCLTVTACGDGWFSVDVMPETLRLTNLGLLRRGDEVNLERALELGRRMGGHLVQGHVDGTGKVMAFVPEGKDMLVELEAPGEIMKYVVKKGFIAVDGISLTVVDGSKGRSFRVSLVSYTRQHATLSKKKPGDVVNLEADIIAKYVERFLSKDGSGVTWEFLAEKGFLR